MQPGKDARQHTQVLQQNIAQSLTSLTGGSVTQNQVMPAMDQPVTSEDLKHIVTEAEPKIDIEDIMAGEEGKPRTEPSKRFLSTLIERLKRKHPNKEIVEKV